MISHQIFVVPSDLSIKTSPQPTEQRAAYTEMDQDNRYEVIQKKSRHYRCRDNTQKKIRQWPSSNDNGLILDVDLAAILDASCRKPDVMRLRLRIRKPHRVVALLGCLRSIEQPRMHAHEPTVQADALRAKTYNLRAKTYSLMHSRNPGNCTDTGDALIDRQNS